MDVGWTGIQVPHSLKHPKNEWDHSRLPLVSKGKFLGLVLDAICIPACPYTKPSALLYDREGSVRTNSGLSVVGHWLQLLWSWVGEGNLWDALKQGGWWDLSPFKPNPGMCTPLDSLPPCWRQVSESRSTAWHAGRSQADSKLWAASGGSLGWEGMLLLE